MDQQLNSLNVLDRNDSYKSNQFTAGTDFMNKLNEQIKFFIAKKNYQAKVIFSGSDVPGEGEHKILDYIRCMKE